MTRRHLPAWLAMLALLTHLLAMSTAGVSAGVQRDHGAVEHLTHVHDGHAPLVESAPAPHSGRDHAGMLQCCCAGFSGLAALPFDPPRLPEGVVRQPDLLPEHPASLPLPREQWPALNPRASPLA